jgi:O-acetylhomoserine/O-acetylserine sulfhydrylase-like pyridoxal-dependent enzyme
MSWPKNICQTDPARGSFGVKGGRGGRTVYGGAEAASIATHVADAKTCVLHPASATHRQLSDAELIAAGVSSVSHSLFGSH